MQAIPWSTIALGSLLLIAARSTGRPVMKSPHTEKSKPPVPALPQAFFWSGMPHTNFRDLGSVRGGFLPPQTGVGGAARPPLTVRDVGALSDFDNVTVRIADVAAYLAVLGDRLRDEL